MPIPDPQRSERDTLDRLLEALRALPDANAYPLANEPQTRHSDRGIDAAIGFDAAGKKHVLLVEVKKSVYPRDAQQVLWQVGRYLAAERSKDRHSNFVPLLAAELISPGAKDLLKKENFGYFDTGGSLFLPAKGAFFYIEKPAAKTFEKTIRGLFKGKRSQVLHALLLRHENWFGVKELANLAEVSPATASETLTALERFEWMATQGQGPAKERRLTAPGALLDEWQKQTLASPRDLGHRRYFVPAMDARSLTARLAELCETSQVEYVLTLEAAAQRYAPFLSSISTVAFRMKPGRAADEVLSELGARVVREGANLTVIETKSRGEFLFKERIDSVWLASSVQIYLDLLRGGGRAKEMADNLRRERIGF